MILSFFSAFELDHHMFRLVLEALDGFQYGRLQLDLVAKQERGEYK